MKRPYDKSGKVGNLVYQRNRFGPICYPRFIPANPRTEKQVTVRSYLATVSAYWRLLSELERLMWGLAGAKQRSRRRMGRSAPLTGFNYFMRVNLRRLNRGGTLVEVPPEEGRLPMAKGTSPMAGGEKRETAAQGGAVRRTYGIAPAILRQYYGILSVWRRCWNRGGRLEQGGVKVLSA